jgi:tetratricopeptide (TPR) repeat protein
MVAAAGVALYLHRSGRPDCETASRTEPHGTVLLICQQEYTSTGHPATGVRLADAHRRSGNLTTAAGLANELLATEARSDALWILGELAIAEGKLDRALSFIQEARKLHRAEQRHASVAKDALALMKIHKENSHFAEALYAVDECITESRTGFDSATEGRCHIAAARALSLVGYFDGATLELELAEPLLPTKRDQAWLWFERGNVLQEQARGKDRSSHEARAVAAFKRALELATRDRATALVFALELNLVFSLAELGDIAQAELHHSTATAINRDPDHESTLAQLAARIAYRRGDLERAFSMNASLYAAMSPGDDRFEVCVMQARIALIRDDLAAAELWARRGIEEVERMRAAQTALELRPWVLASRRAAYELLFVALARAGRFEEAVAVFDRWQGHTLIEAMARPELGKPPRLAEMASKIESLARLMPAASRAPLLSGEARDVAAALRSIDLFALVVAEGDVWRVTALRGQVRIEKLGALNALSELLDGFKARPTEVALADAAGERLAPAELFGAQSTLHVVLDAELASLPVVALRRGGKPLITARPVLRLPRLPPSPTDIAAAGILCAAPAKAGGATVLADADGSLPDARTESAEIAPLLATTPLVGAAATSKALFAAKPHSVLHVAVHAGFDTYGGVLRMHDVPVAALDIAAQRLGPPLVVLSACSTALSADPELAGSLSTAFLASGSSHVVATLRPVRDRGSVEVMRRFYKGGGIADPVRTLAAVQAELAGTENKDWPNFAVFGSDACAAGAPGGTR